MGTATPWPCGAPAWGTWSCCQPVHGREKGFSCQCSTPMASSPAKLNPPWQLSLHHPTATRITCTALCLHREHHSWVQTLQWLSFSSQPHSALHTLILGISRAVTANIQRHPEQQHIVPSPTPSSGSIFQTDDMREASM